jgi:rhamnosyltransferase subunit B
MKAVLLASGTDGDVHPLLGIGVELASRGHGVLVFTTGEYVDLFRRFGLEAISFHAVSDRQAFMGGAGPRRGAWGAFLAGRQRLAAQVAHWCALILPHVDADTILVAPPLLSSVARPIREARGVPLVTIILAPAFLFSLRNPPLLGSRLVNRFAALPFALRSALYRLGELLILDRMVGMTLDEVTRQLGLRRPSRIYSRWLYSPDSVLALFPEWFSQRPRPDDWPANMIHAGFPLFSETSCDRSLPEPLPGFLAAGPAPILFTPGTRKVNHGDFFATALAALDRLAARGLFVTRDGVERLPDLPPTVLHVPYVSFELLLPRVAALVHQGGIGTAAYALSTGTPQLIVPNHVDQFDNGRLVARLGTGLAIADPADPGEMAAKLGRLTRDPAIKAACRRWQQQVAPSRTSIARAAAEIERTWAERSRGSREPAFATGLA